MGRHNFHWLVLDNERFPLLTMASTAGGRHAYVEIRREGDYGLALVFLSVCRS